MAAVDDLALLQVRITAEGEQFLKVMKAMRAELDEFKKHAKEAHSVLDKLGEKVTHFGKDVGKDIANRLLGGLGFGGLAAGIAAGTVQLVERAYAAMEKRESAEIRMNAILQANHRNVQQLSNDYKQYAEEVRNSSDMTRLQVQGLLTLAETYGLTGDAAKRAARDAAALGEVTGHGPEAMMKFIAMIEQGELKQAMMFRRLIPQLRDAKNVLDMLKKLEPELEAGRIAAEEKAKTTGAAYRRMGEQIENTLADAATWFLRQTDLDKFPVGKPPAGPPELSSQEKAVKGAAKDLKTELEEQEKAYRKIGLSRAEAAKQEYLELYGNTILHDADVRRLLKELGLQTELNQAKEDGVKYLKGAEDYVRQIDNATEAIGLNEIDKKVLQARKRLDDFKRENPVDNDETRRVTRELTFQIDRTREAAMKSQAATIAESQKLPQEKMRDYQDMLYLLLNRRLLTQEQVNRALDEEQQKIYGVAQAMQASQSAFSGATAQARYEAYSRSMMNVPSSSAFEDRSGVKGAAYGKNQVDSGVKSGPGADLNPTPTAGVKTGEELQKQTALLAQIAGAVTAGGVRFVTVDAGGSN